MLNVDIITVVPELFSGPFDHSIIKRAKEKEFVKINIINLRDYSSNKYKSVDDYMYGGGAGMVMMVEPVDKCISELRSKRRYDEVIYMAPDGELLTQSVSNHYSAKKNLIVICGHYKGIDERIRQHLVTKEISIGDFVLTGGELPAMVFIDSIVRLIPGVISDETSALSDSFQDNLISPPAYTRPSSYKGWEVPEVLLSGDQAKIDAWRHEKAIERTKERRPGLFDGE